MRQYKLFNLKKEFIDFCCEKPEDFTGIIEFDGGVAHWYLNGKHLTKKEILLQNLKKLKGLL